MKILGIAGTQNTGKTTLITLIVKELVNRGYKVGTIKHTHHDFDMEGKDTWKHREAGAELVVGSGERTFIIMNERMELEKIIKDIKFLKELDYLIIEGFKFSNYPKISTTPAKDEYTITNVDVFNLKPEEIKTLVDLVEKRTYGLISNTNCGYCGYESCQDMGQAIVKGEVSEDECKMKKFQEVELFIEDKNIPLNPFVQDILKKSIIGMLSTLNTEDQNIQGKVELLIRNGPQ
ncbi:MAG TPA: molybdopterin-guanine dinucleotide biosynthesis protein B [Methanobacterium sp.]|nr:molybdopterin-guanine dinucleotide biosynthesis protein B [Methanobacterium sp.]